MTFAKGDPQGALTLYRDALASCERVGDRPEVARLHCEMGWTALAAGDAHAAQRAFVRGVHANEEVGSARGTGLALLGLAAVEAKEGRSERAVAIAAAAHALSERAGVVVDHPMDPGRRRPDRRAQGVDPEGHAGRARGERERALAGGGAGDGRRVGEAVGERRREARPRVLSSAPCGDCGDRRA